MIRKVKGKTYSGAEVLYAITHSNYRGNVTQKLPENFSLIFYKNLKKWVSLGSIDKNCRYSTWHQLPNMSLENQLLI